MTVEEIRKAKAGEFVRISGEVFIARDRTLQKIFEGRIKIPKMRIVYFCGPVRRKGKIVSAGPTTSARMEWAFERLMRTGTRIFIGKGEISAAATKSIRGRAVYLEAPGGCGALLASKIKRSEIVAFPELRAQALAKLEIEDFPAIVSVDIRGTQIAESRKASRKA